MLYIMCHVTHKKFNMEQTTINNYTNTTTTTMKALTLSQKAHIFSLLSASFSAKKAHTETGHSLSTISKLRSHFLPDLEKSIGGCPAKLTPIDIKHAICLLSSQKAVNAVQVTKAL